MFMLNFVDGCVPSDLGAGTAAELEEERRLPYVGMTRAHDNLTLAAAALLYALFAVDPSLTSMPSVDGFPVLVHHLL